MKVIVSTPNWIISGVNSFNLNLLRTLQSAGYSVELLVIHQDTPAHSTLTLPTDIPVVHLEFDSSRSWWDVRWQALKRYLNAAGPCVYLPGYDFQNASVVPTLNDDVIVVGVIHSDEDEHYEHLIRMGRYWNAVITVSNHIHAHALDIEPSVADRCRRIGYGVRHLEEAPAPRSPAAPLRIVYSGRFDERQKRVSDLPKIAAALKQRGIEAEWLLIGDGPEEAGLKSGFASAIGWDIARFTGRLTNDRTLREFTEGDILILTSAYEGLPVAMLEGMGHGLIPVVTQIDSGVDDLIVHGENGFKVPVGDIDRFVDAIAFLNDNPSARSAMRQAAFATIVEGEYSIEHVVERYLEVFAAARLAVDEGRYKRPKSYRPNSWTGDFAVPPVLQIAPDAYYNLKGFSEWQTGRIRELEAQLSGPRRAVDRLFPIGRLLRIMARARRLVGRFARRLAA